MKPRIEYDDKGEIDEIVSDGGAHLERLDKKLWWLAMHNSDGTTTAIWFEGKIVMHEFREAIEALKQEAER